MLRTRSRLICAVLTAASAAACMAAPDAGPSFRDMQAEQAAIQAALADGVTDASRVWQGPDGGHGSVALIGEPDAAGCRRVRAATPSGRVTDTWCPTPHGFWVHPDELFYRNATGLETYGGDARSGDAKRSAAGPADDVDPLRRIDCLNLLQVERRLLQDGRDADARAQRRAYHRCLHQAR